MKKELAVPFASVLVLLLAAVTASAYVTNNFNGAIHASWQNSSRAVLSNAPGALTVGGTGGSLYIPTLSVATNVTGSGSAASEKKVWTDFYTIPRPFYSDTLTSPVVDTNATAQFFVNTNGMWVTISGGGTNICQSVLSPVGATYPTVTSFTTFYHVSVLHDYSNMNWSLFVNDNLLATNLNFIASGVTTHTWFQVQNLGGDSNDVSWLDDFMVANRLPASGNANALTNVVPGTALLVSDALASFGSMTDPRPTNETVGVVANGVNLSFGRIVLDGRSYAVVGTTNYNLSGLASRGFIAEDGGFTDTVSWATSSKQYYKLVTVSADAAISVTNDETYAAYKQARDRSRAYYVGAPILTSDGDRTLAGTLGQQLASGLTAGDKLYIYVNDVAEAYTLAGGVWTGPDTSRVIAPGQGVKIQRYATGPATSSAFLAGTVPTNAPVVTVVEGWNIVAWPFGSTGTLVEFAGLTPADATLKDYMFLQNGTDNITIGHYTTGGWKAGYILGGGGTQVLNPTLEPGAGILIRHYGADGQWSP